MEIAYVSLNDVNRYQAVRFAPDGMSVAPRLAVGPLPEGEFDGRVYDLDHFPAGLRQEVLEDLTEAPPAVPTAVHSLCLEEEQVIRLRRNGVRVHRHLAPAILEGFLRGSYLVWG